MLALMLNLSWAVPSLIQLLTFFSEWHACTLDGFFTYTTAHPYTYTPSHLVAWHEPNLVGYAPLCCINHCKHNTWLFAFSDCLQGCSLTPCFLDYWLAESTIKLHDAQPIICSLKQLFTCNAFLDSFAWVNKPITCSITCSFNQIGNNIVLQQCFDWMLECMSLLFFQTLSLT